MSELKFGFPGNTRWKDVVQQRNERNSELKMLG